MKNQSVWKRLGDFAMGKGFYIVLFLCVATIGISGYYLLQTVLSGTRAVSPAGADASVTIPDQSTAKPAVPTPKPSENTPARPAVPSAKPAPQPDDPEPVKDTAPEPDTTQTLSQVFTWPVQGSVLRDFSVEVLSLDPTLGDWRTHGGLDIAAEQGMKVMAISAGTVEQVYQDGLMGATVVVDHGGGLRSWYCNLAEETSVREGDQVEIGTVLGTVGSTAIAEIGMEPHLHLETVLNGQPVDPRDYLN